jgi:ABC-2 type transport system permease protein
MSWVRSVFELGRRDFVTRIRSRAFIVSMLLIVGIVVAAGPLIAVTANEEEPSASVGYVTGAPEDFARLLSLQGDAVGIAVTPREFSSTAAGEAALDAGELGALVDGSETVWQGEPWLALRAATVSALTLATRAEVAAQMEVRPDDVARLLNPVTTTERRLVQADPEEEPRRVAALAGMILLYISILMFGQFVLMGVMEEKQNRVVEVVLSRATPVQVLTAKVVGIGLLGLIQLIVLGGAGVFTANLVDLADVDLGAIGIGVLAAVVGWYLLGYAFYSVIYGGLGATVSRQEDTQGIVLLPVLFLLPGFFIAQFALLEPETTLVRVASWLPFWSPMVMSVRTAVTDVPIWEVVVAIVLLVASTIGLVRLAARIYTGAVLRIGAKVRLREAWRAAAD